MPIEKTVFISYRRTNSFHARAIFQDLRNHGYDVFLDYENIDSGAFDQIIINQIKARAHFIVILTPSALERCTDPNDWLRREIETAIEYKRNIIPLMFEGFNWDNMRQYLVGQMTILDTYNALDVPVSYFDSAMERLRTRFLNTPIDAVIHPVPKEDAKDVAQKMGQMIYSPVVQSAQLRAGEYFEKGNQYHFNRQYDKAIPAYTESLRLNPYNPTAYCRRGIAYERTGEPNKAYADYEQAIIEATYLLTQNPNDAELYRARGVAYTHQMNYEYAIMDYNEAIRLNSQYAIVYNNRGWAYYNQKDYDRAIADYTEAISLNPDHSDTYHNRGIVYEDKMDYEHAIADYTEAIRLNPNLALAYNNRGNIYLNIKSYDLAIADFDRALKLNPNDELSRRNRELALQKKRGG